MNHNTRYGGESYPNFNPNYAVEDPFNTSMLRDDNCNNISSLSNDPTVQQQHHGQTTPSNINRSIHDHPLTVTSTTNADHIPLQQPYTASSHTTDHHYQSNLSSCIATTDTNNPNSVDHYMENDIDNYELSSSTRAMIGTTYDNDDNDTDNNDYANGLLLRQQESQWTHRSDHGDEYKTEISPLHPTYTGIWSHNNINDDCTLETEVATVLDVAYSPQHTQLRRASTSPSKSKPAANDVAVRLQQQLMDDARIASRIREEEEMLLAMKLSAAYGGHSDSSNNRSRSRQLPTQYYNSTTSNEQHATVVEIASHDAYTTTASTLPYRLGSTNIHHGDTTAAQAEWIGSSSSSSSLIPTTATTTNPITSVNDGSGNTADAYEVAVIDSTPMDDAMIQMMGYTEVARIVTIGDDNNSTTNNTYDDDRKPAALPIRRSSENRNRNHDNSSQVQNQVLQHVHQPVSTSISQSSNIFNDQTISSRTNLMQNQRFDEVLATSTTSMNDLAAEVVSIHDERDVHPILRSTYFDSESNSQAQLVGLDHSFQTTSSTDINNLVPSTSTTVRPIVVNNTFPIVLDTDPSISLHQEAGIIPIHQGGEINTAETGCSDHNVAASCELVGTTAFTNSTDQSHSIVREDIVSTTSTGNDAEVVAVICSDQQAEVIGIQDEGEVHPSDIDSITRQSIANAELIGAINHLNIESRSGEALSFSYSSSFPVDTSVVTDNINVEGSVVTAAVVEEAPVIVATAFTDPHQPFLSPIAEENDNIFNVQDDEDMARTLQDAENLSRTLHEDENLARTLQNENDARVLHDTNHSGSDESLIVNTISSVAPEVDAVAVPSPIVVNSTTTINTNIEGINSNLQHQSTPDPRGVDLSAREVSHDSTISDSTTSNHSNSFTNSIGRGTTLVLEALFGDIASPLGIRRQNTSENEHVRHVVPRTLLPCSVIFNRTTNMWVATIQTNQRALDEKNAAAASKSLRAFSMPSEKQARSLARSWTPPRMNLFSDYKFCHICKHKFALLRRACHCRNCGVCVCKDCSVQWPAKMVPDTYNFKKEIVLNVCKSCDWLSVAFRLALLHGDYDRSLQLHSTGNVNLHTPFANVKGELFYPVHCAALGGNLNLLKFLVDENCCPIRNIRVASNNKDSRKYVPIVTSKGRSLLGIALELENLSLLHYLVAEKGLSLSGENDITIDIICRNFEKLLRGTPPTMFLNDSNTIVSEQRIAEVSSLPNIGEVNGQEHMAVRTSINNDSVNQSNSPLEQTQATIVQAFPQRSTRFSSEVASTTDEDCIICFDNAIDCVATPCGHSVCCLACSTHLTICPVCNSTATFIKIFRA